MKLDFLLSLQHKSTIVHFSFFLLLQRSGHHHLDLVMTVLIKIKNLFTHKREKDLNGPFCVKNNIFPLL